MPDEGWDLPSLPQKFNPLARKVPQSGLSETSPKLPRPKTPQENNLKASSQVPDTSQTSSIFRRCPVQHGLLRIHHLPGQRHQHRASHGLLLWDEAWSSASRRPHVGSQAWHAREARTIYHLWLEYFFFFLNNIVPRGLGFLYAVYIPKSLYPF